MRWAVFILVCIGVVELPTAAYSQVAHNYVRVILRDQSAQILHLQDYEGSVEVIEAFDCRFGQERAAVTIFEDEDGGEGTDVATYGPFEWRWRQPCDRECNAAVTRSYSGLGRPINIQSRVLTRAFPLASEALRYMRGFFGSLQPSTDTSTPAESSEFTRSNTSRLDSWAKRCGIPT